MKRKIAISVILISILISYIAISKVSTSDKLFKQGVQYKQNRQYSEAIKIYTEILTLHPDSTAARYSRAELYEREKNYDMAIQDYSKIIEIFPGEFSAHQKRASLYRIIGRSDLEDADYKVYHRIGEAEIRNFQGQECEKKGKYDEAIKAYTEAIELSPSGGMYETYRLRAGLYKKIGRSDLADDDYKIANIKRKEIHQRDKENGFEDNDWWMGIIFIIVLMFNIVSIGMIVFFIYKFIKKHSIRSN